MSRRLLAAIAGLVLVATVTAFTVSGAQAGRQAPAKAKKSLTFYLIPGISTDAFYTTMHKGAQAAASKLGVKLVFQGAPNAFSPQTQIPILNAAIQRHPDAILIAPTDKTALIAPINNAIKAGIPVITVDTFITKNIAVTNVSSDNVAGGKKEHAKTAQLCTDCGECCKTCATLCARQSPLAGPMLECCAKCCDQCAAACEKLPDDKHMAACAKSCRDCAKDCRAMLKHLDK